MRLDRLLRRELPFSINQSMFWTDSAAVLQSIYNNRKRFPVFVANRLAEIERCSQVKNWRHVPSKLNPADFIKLMDHSGKKIAEQILNVFEKLDIDFEKCRGQSYDNAANMAGKYNGVQQKILEKNEFPKFIPCAGHSLNLVGRAAVNSCLDAVNFFGVIKELHCFFSASTRRWAVLKSCLPPGSKNLQHLTHVGRPMPKRRPLYVKILHTSLKLSLVFIMTTTKRVIQDYKLEIFGKNWKNWKSFLCFIFGQVC